MRASSLPPEEWALDADVQQLLAYMLVMPQGDHSSGVQQNLNGVLTEAHVVGLYRLIDGKTPVNWTGSSQRTARRG